MERWVPWGPAIVIVVIGFLMLAVFPTWPVLLLLAPLIALMVFFTTKQRACPQCGHVVTPDPFWGDPAQFCPRCGTALSNK